jgi:hypothetical protein
VAVSFHSHKQGLKKVLISQVGRLRLMTERALKEAYVQNDSLLSGFEAAEPHRRLSELRDWFQEVEHFVGVSVVRPHLGEAKNDVFILFPV